MNKTELTPPWLDWPETSRLVAAFGAAPVRFVGGCVRDALLGLPAKDLDLATPLPPEEVLALLAEANLKSVPTGLTHGTVTALVGRRHFEITTLRKDVETFGRHARIEYTGDWKQDATRRDFTMNALYLSPEGKLFDYFGGAGDAREGRVRFIGDASARIAEDYLRILRFFRFRAWYGKGEPDALALSACADAASHIAALSGERIRQEMLKLLSASAPSATLALMPPSVLRQAFGFPVHHIGILAELERIETTLPAKPDALVRLALLLPSVAAFSHLAEKWRLSNEQTDTLRLWLEQAPKLAADASLSAQKKMLRELGAEAFRSLVLIRWAKEPEAAVAWQAMHRLADEWTPPEFPLSGDDLLKAGIPEGKALGATLRGLEEAWEESDYRLTKEQLLALTPSS